MRKFKRTFKVSSDAVQGPGSYVIFRNRTWGEVKADIASNMTNAESAANRVVEWNWTDDENKALPLPSQEPGVIDRLVAEEVEWLVNAIQQWVGDDEIKNLK